MGEDGSADQGYCARWGIVKFVTAEGERLAMKVECRTWRCVSCRRKNRAIVEARMLNGLSILGKCYFITTTYQRGKRTLVSAHVAQEDWKRFIQMLKDRNPKYRKIAWFKVVEVTLAGMPHFHVLIGDIGQRLDDCEDNHVPNAKWRDRPCPEQCLAHEMSSAWYSITGDSWVVHVREVYQPAGVVDYMSKYLTKSFDKFEELEDLGFHRRWSRSRNWPSIGDMKTRGKEMGLFVASVYERRGTDQEDKLLKLVDDCQFDRRLEIIGNEYMEQRALLSRRTKLMNQLKEVIP